MGMAGAAASPEVIGRAVPHRRPPDLERADPGLDPALRAIAVAHDALRPVRQPLLGELAEENLDLGLKRRREHPARAFSGDLGEGVSTEPG
jgi:hypothetical protein